MVDLSVLLQFHAWHLLDEGIEHGAFSQLEGIGIVDQRVATIVEHHLRSRHLHLLQGVALPLYVERRQLARVFTLVQVLQTEREIGGLIAHVADTQQIVLRQLWDGKRVEGVVATLLALHPERAGLAGVEGGAVGGKQLHGSADEFHVGQMVVDVACNNHLLHLPWLMVLHVDVAPFHFHTYRLALAKLPDSLGHREPLQCGRNLQPLQVVVDEGQRVGRLLIIDGGQGFGQRHVAKRVGDGLSLTSENRREAHEEE